MSHRYITTTLPYLNAEPHIGFAIEIIRADAWNRYRQTLGDTVFFNTGTDEHGQKIWQKAQDAGLDPKAYTDSIVSRFVELKSALSLSGNLTFVRTTDQHHIAAAQEFWRRVDAAGYVYKKNYQVKYCVGCELEKTDSELVDGRCVIHNDKPIEERDEENYFFKFSAFQDKLLQLYSSKSDFVVPDFRQKEITTFVQNGLQDFSISRLKSKMPWGVSVPDDDHHVMYVWFDALVNYISTLGWPESQDDFNTYWQQGMPIQYCGKDNLRQQSAMWQAMLMAAELPNSHQIIINGFINSEGKKMSKSLGNVISPYQVIDMFKDVSAFSHDVLRYYLLRHVHPFEDSDVTYEKIKESYTGNLVNGLGNLVNRILKMSETNLDNPVKVSTKVEYSEVLQTAVNQYRWHDYLDEVWRLIGEIDEQIATTMPFKVVKTDILHGQKLITQLVHDLAKVAVYLAPVLPDTAQSILQHIAVNKKPDTPLFARL